MRNYLRHRLPNHEAIRGSRWLAPFQNTLLHPRLWHLNRRSAAGAVAAGLFCGLIPGPFQMLGAALCAVVFRINLPLALFTTLYTNPLTIVPLYIIAFGLGKFATGEVGEFITPPDYDVDGLLAWIHALTEWMTHLGRPLAVGLLFLAGGLAALGYLLTRLVWRIYLVSRWRQRRRFRSI